jgi:hypothetical protein
MKNLSKAFALAVIAAASIAFSEAHAALNVRQAAIAGRPTNMNREGIYIFKVGNDLHVVTVNRGGDWKNFSGRGTNVGGTVSNLRFLYGEAGDRVKRVDGNTVHFKYEVVQGTDGFAFQFNGGTALRLYFERDGRHIKTTDVFLGQNKTLRHTDDGWININT